MTTTNDALRAARDVIVDVREDDFASFTVGRDPESMEPGESAIIARYDAALSQIDAALAGEAVPDDVVERVADAIELQMITDDNAPSDLARVAIAAMPAPGISEAEEVTRDDVLEAVASEVSGRVADVLAAIGHWDFTLPDLRRLAAHFINVGRQG